MVQDTDAKIILHLLRYMKELSASCVQPHPTTLELPKWALYHGVCVDVIVAHYTVTDIQCHGTRNCWE